MILTEEELQMFEQLSAGIGKRFIAYLERLKREELWNPEKITRDNIDSTKAACKLIDDEIIARIENKTENNKVESFD